MTLGPRLFSTSLFRTLPLFTTLSLASGLGGLLGACGADEDFGRLPDARIAIDAGRVSDAGTAPAPDGGSPPTCDPVTGAGCGSPLEACKLFESPRCVRSSGLGKERGEACATGECAPGLSCLRTSETSSAAAVCLELCVLETGAGCDAQIDDYECRLRIEGQPYGACVDLPPLCSPYTQRPCSAEEACQPFLRRTGARELRCQRAGAQAAGEPCGPRLGACGRGLVCVAETSRPGEPAVCRQYCELNADCPAPEQCAGRVDDPSFTFCLP